MTEKALQKATALLRQWFWHMFGIFLARVMAWRHRVSLGPIWHVLFTNYYTIRDTAMVAGESLASTELSNVKIISRFDFKEFCCRRLKVQSSTNITSTLPSVRSRRAYIDPTLSIDVRGCNAGYLTSQNSNNNNSL
jgi:hypothetical protein